MNIRIITQCTSRKAYSPANQLTLADFQAGPAAIAAKRAKLVDYLLPAQDMYTGDQHQRLMRGYKKATTDAAAAGHPWQADLWILSAGYGLLPAAQRIAPYNATFKDMGGPAKAAAWAGQLDVPAAIRRALAPHRSGQDLRRESRASRIEGRNKRLDDRRDRCSPRRKYIRWCRRGCWRWTWWATGRRSPRWRTW